MGAGGGVGGGGGGGGAGSTGFTAGAGSGAAVEAEGTFEVGGGVTRGVVEDGGGGGGSLGTLAGGIEDVAGDGAVVEVGGIVVATGLLVGVTGVAGLKAGSELSIESLRSAYPLIYQRVSCRNMAQEEILFTCFASGRETSCRRETALSGLAKRSMICYEAGRE